MGVYLIEVPAEFIEALSLWDAGGVLIAQTPFADQTGMVTRLLQDFGDGNISRSQCLVAITSNPCVTRVQTGHQSASGRSADGAAGVEIGKAHSFSRQFIQVRGFNLRLAVATQI